ncbi:MAG: DNA mismatch repair protein MutS [Bacteroidota bacterium]
MQQYFQQKAKYPNTILLFRVGDFYETFGEDAITASQVLGIIQTRRNNGGSDIELAGFPYHSLDMYLPRLVRSGLRVAICEQLEKPSKEKKIVRRGVVEVVTPGVAVNDKLLDHRQNNFLASVSFGRQQMGVAFLDISTGEFLVSQGSPAAIDKLLQSLRPSEVIFSKDKKKDFNKYFGDGFYQFVLDEWVYTTDYTQEKLLTHFQVKNLKGFGIDELDLAKIAAGAILHYLATTENKNLRHINAVRRIQSEKYVWLDRFTIRNLELVYSPHESGVSLAEVLDKTLSPMGARLMRKWVLLPLLDPAAIRSRHDMVEFFIRERDLNDEIERFIRQIGDLERLISKVPLNKINPREIVQLRRAMESIHPIRQLLAECGDVNLQKLADSLQPCDALIERVKGQVKEDPPVNLAKGGVIAEGCSKELDELRNIVQNSKDLLLEIQQSEAQRTGINSLKIGFNNVFGYYLEVTNKYKNMVPEEWVRKQTLTGSERYITDELKKLESKILGAEEKILQLEERLYAELVSFLTDFIQPVQQNASIIARIDCLQSFARVSLKNAYRRPDINEGHAIDIKQGRHPVIEQQLALDESYVPNDVYLDNEAQQILMITGPNMAGKSALLRQTALIALMAQMGCFVPAESASIGIVDKIFTRVGATDNISSGESTFMVEMNETASIMNNISNRSLILLDEIGRGTSTYDGISIAWSIAEFLHNHPSATAKTLFATHYHELNELAAKFERIKNFHIATKEVGNKVIFLRKLTAGGSNHSFGIYVAKMAGMPYQIVERANDILGQLEQKQIEVGGSGDIQEKLQQLPAAQAMQLSIFETVDPTAGKIKEVLMNLQLNSMTPIECMMKLNELKQLIEEAEA